MTTPDRIAAIRDILRDMAGWSGDGKLCGKFGCKAPEYAKPALAHLDALEKEREELRAAVRELDDYVSRNERRMERVLSHGLPDIKPTPAAVQTKHADTIAGCKQQGDGDE